jgi:hypothetical protein
MQDMCVNIVDNLQAHASTCKQSAEICPEVLPALQVLQRLTDQRSATCGPPARHAHRGHGRNVSNPELIRCSSQGWA